MTDYRHPCAGDMCLNTVCCEDQPAVIQPKINHRWAIIVLERKIADNRVTAMRCRSYGDPQDQIDVYYDMNDELLKTVAFLKELK